jgi:hypothetical protein
MPSINFSKTEKLNVAQKPARLPPVEKAAPIVVKTEAKARISGNPAAVNIIVRKQLTAYPNYGYGKSADILYTGTEGTWNIEMPQYLLMPGKTRAQVVIRACLDDHKDISVNRYFAKITFNGVAVHSGRLPLEHGLPSAGVFTNWRELTFNITNLKKDNIIVIKNLSTVGPKDWIGLDSIEIRQF